MMKEYQKAKTPVNRYFLFLGLTPRVFRKQKHPSIAIFYF